MLLHLDGRQILWSHAKVDEVHSFLTICQAKIAVFNQGQIPLPDDF
ncbi:MAG: hypothetical protein AAF804_08265 [Bacteroidota bacterium]